MRLTARFSLIGIGIILFLIATPFLVFYARGFIIDWKTGHITKTGALVVHTQPTKALVYLNDELKANTTPSNIRFVIPGDFNVRIEKDGYQSWTKRLTIRPQLVTWANENRDAIFLFLKNPTLGNTLNLNQLSTIKPENNPNPDEVWTVQKNLLKRYKKSTNTTDIISQTVPLAKTAEVIRSNNQVYLILDNKLYVLNDTFEKIYDNVIAATWDAASQQLLFSNNNEILIYNPASKNSELILRSSTPIGNPVLNWTTGYIFYQNEGKIKAIEVEGRDHRNIYTISDAAKNFALDEAGKTLSVISDTDIKQYTIR